MVGSLTVNFLRDTVEPKGYFNEDIATYLSNRTLLRVYIASSKHKEGWENLGQLLQTLDYVSGLRNFHACSGSVFFIKFNLKFILRKDGVY